MKTQPPLKLFLLVLTLAPQLSTLFAQDTAFTYQGRLNNGVVPANGSYDFRFVLHGDAILPGFEVGQPRTNSAVSVTNGTFTTIVDFGPVWDSQPRWLELGVRPAGSPNDFAPLTPRQPVTVTPKADYANRAALLTSPLSEGLLPTSVVRDYVDDTISGLFTFAPLAGNPPFLVNSSVRVTNLNADLLDGLDSSAFWKLSGNSGTSAGVNFLGTTDNQALTVKVNNVIALRFVPGTTLPNLVGGLGAVRPSVLTAGVSGAVIAGGNAPSGAVNGLGGGDFHAVYDNDGTVGGGFGNKVGSNNADITDGAFATVAGGVFNSAANYAATVAGGDGNYAGGPRTFIGGGYGNQAWANLCVLGGGFLNSILAGADYSTLGGGNANFIQASVPYATIAGGLGNVIQTNSSGATISGGQNNSVSPGGIGYVSAKGASIGGGEGNTIYGFGGFPEVPLYNEYGTIGGGYSNRVQGSYGTVPGGYLNTASGEFSFAAGRRAKANHYGSFVWADTQNADFASTSDNQFNIRAANGVRLNTDTSLCFGNSGASKLWPDQGGAVELGNSTAVGVTPYIDFHYGFGSAQDFNVRIMNDGPEILSIFRSGSATRLAQFSPAGLSVNGTFVSTSDRNRKENFKPVNSRDVLAKVAALPFSRWNYKDDKTSEHIGPMAQDFYAAFGVGPDDKHIATVDADGVALAAIQGLNQKVEEKNAEIADLKRELEQLKQIVDKLINH